MISNKATESLTSIVATYIHDLQFKDIPRKVIEPVKDSLIDAIGCGVIGSTSKHVQILTGYFTGMRSAEESVIWGTSKMACVPFAAAANSAAIHAWDFDDAILPGPTHPAGIMNSTALSIAEKMKKNVNGKEFLTAIIAGYEISNLMAAALGGAKWRLLGFYNTVPVVFGSAAVAGKLLGLDKEKLIGALGIAATQAAGLYSATMTKRLNAAKAVEAGIYAAELANRGFEAPLDGIGDEQGFLKTFSRDPQWDVIPREIGKYAFEVYHKIYPCIRSNHPSIYAVSLLRDEHPKDISAETIKKITVYADELTRMYTIGTPGGGTTVKTVGNALVSLPYCVAAMIVDGELTLDQFTEEKIRNPVIQGLLKKVEILVDAEIGNLPITKRYRATVEIELDNGMTYKKFCPAPKGDPTNRMSKAEMYDKYIKNTTTVFNKKKMDDLFKLLENIEESGDVRKIAGYLLNEPGY